MRALAILALLWLAGPLAAQQNVPPVANPGGIIYEEQIRNPGDITYEEYEQQVIEGAGGVPAPPGAATEAGTRLRYSATDEMRSALGEAVYDDHIALLDYNRRVFEWQMTSTIVSFWMVIALVVAGLAFAGVQFWRAMRATAGDPGMTTDLELGTKGLKVSSPVLGVIILTISLGFFYLYLRHVYPIEHVRGGTPPPAAPEAGAEE